MSRIDRDRVVLRGSRRRPRTVLVVPLASALILVVGWAVLWNVARREAESELDRLLAREAAHGRIWACPDRTLSGFPFRIALDCPGLAFSGLVDGSPAEGHLGGLRAETYLYEPSSVYVSLAGPMTLSSRDGRADVTLDWSQFRATVRGLLGGLNRAELVVDGASLSRPGAAPSRADRVELHAGPASGRPAEDAAAAVDLSVSGAAIPPLDAVSGEAGTLDGSFAGTVSRAYGDLPDFGPATVERWREAGGHLDIDALRLSKGPLEVAAAGTLGLDAQHRLAGQLSTSLVGFGPLAKRFGIPLDAVRFGGMLGKLLGGAAPQVPAAAPKPGAAAPGAVELPITLADGAVSIGPVRLPVLLRPLY